MGGVVRGDPADVQPRGPVGRPDLDEGLRLRVERADGRSDRGGRELGDGARTAILAGGTALALLLGLAPAVLGRPWGYTVGWVLQAVFLATGFVLPTMFFVGGLSVLAWWYAVRTGARLDRENAARDAAQAQWEREHPDG